VIDKYPIPELPDAEYERMSPDRQHKYNQKIGAKDEYTRAKKAYETAMSLWGPAILTVIGIIGIAVFFLGLILIAVAIIWAFFRVAARSQAYQRYKDAEVDLKAAIAAEKE